MACGAGAYEKLSMSETPFSRASRRQIRADPDSDRSRGKFMLHKQIQPFIKRESSSQANQFTRGVFVRINARFQALDVVGKHRKVQGFFYALAAPPLSIVPSASVSEDRRQLRKRYRILCV